jgi:hypothetical protein
MLSRLCGDTQSFSPANKKQGHEEESIFMKDKEIGLSGAIFLLRISAASARE